MEATVVPGARIGLNIGELARNWWVLALRGVLTILFGLIILLGPEVEVLWVLAVIFGVFALAEGLMLLFSLRRATGSSRDGAALQGIVGILIGLVALFWPVGFWAGLVLLLAAWMLVGGVTQIYNAFNLPSGVPGRGLMGVCGFLFAFFALILIFHPLSGVLALAWLFGALALISGIAMLILGFKVKSLCA